MLPFHDTSRPHGVGPPLPRAARWVAQASARSWLDLALSWLAWLLVMIAFVLWTHAHYQPAAPAWIGMTVRTGLFAIWTLILREWIVLRLVRRHED